MGTTWKEEVVAYFNVSQSISTDFVDLDLFLSFLNYTKSVGLLGRGISPSQDRYLHTDHMNTE
jgi:hypothetical protein